MQWGLAKIQPPGSIVNLNISCDIYCISATSIDGDWPYIKLIDNTKFKLVVNAQKAFWICLGIADKQQWGLSDNIQRQTITFPISFPKICYHITWTATSSAGNPYKTSGYVNSVTNISFLARADDTACQKYWFAVGV